MLSMSLNDYLYIVLPIVCLVIFLDYQHQSGHIRTRFQEYTSKWATVLVVKPGATIAAAATALRMTVIMVTVLHPPPPRANLRAPAATPVMVVATDMGGGFCMRLDLRASLFSVELYCISRVLGREML